MLKTFDSIENSKQVTITAKIYYIKNENKVTTRQIPVKWNRIFAINILLYFIGILYLCCCRYYDDESKTKMKQKKYREI